MDDPTNSAGTDRTTDERSALEHAIASETRSPQQALTTLSNLICECTLCALAESRTQAVLGSGRADARLVLIGEAPGKKEDETGEPFAGRAGRILDEALEGADLDRDAIYITSVVKCRPENNRNPYVGEIRACAAYLDEQLRIIDPPVVGLFGNTPSKARLGKTGITSFRGEVLERAGRLIVPTFHPAAVLRNPNRMDVFIEDLNTMARLIQEGG